MHGPPSRTVNLVGPSGMENGDTVYSCFSHNSLPTLLDHAQPAISWKYYANSTDADQSGPEGIWTAPNAIYDICLPNSDSPQPHCMGPDWINDVVFTPSQILSDLGAGGATGCGLRQVSWVVPNGDRSDHPGFSGSQNDSHQIEGGPAWVADIINAVGTSPCQNPDTSSYWNTTAIFVVWDDWGGFWDHVDPNGTGGPGVHFNCTNWGCGYTYGVPCAPAGGFGVYICGLRFRQHPKPRRNVPLRPRLWQHLAFIENNFNLGIGNINAQNQYLFADAHAPFGANGNIPLADFFPLTTPRTFERINVPAAWQTFDANYFLNYTGPILDPDNDAIDND